MSIEKTTQSLTLGVHHVGLTVPDIKQTSTFFTQLLGYTVAAERPSYPAIFVSDGHTLITLWQANQDYTGFDRHKNVGLHHMAIRLNSIDALHTLHNKLINYPDVSIEFAPEPLGSTPLVHMMCNIPGGVRIEFIAQPEN